MKKVLPLVFLALALMGLSSIKNNTTNYSEGTIGDVKYSVLAETTFTKLNPGWVLMDGQDVSNTEYQRITGFTKVPNATGNFIRGMSKYREVGAFQGYSTALPKYTDFKVQVFKNGSHSHNFEFGRSDKAAGSQMDKTRFIDLYDGNDGGRIWTESSGKHGHETSISGGDYETRPDNIALYVYIKVN